MQKVISDFCIVNKKMGGLFQKNKKHADKKSPGSNLAQNQTFTLQ